MLLTGKLEGLWDDTDREGKLGGGGGLGDGPAPEHDENKPKTATRSVAPLAAGG